MQVMSILVRPVRVNLAADILRHSSALSCVILLRYSPDSAIFSDIRELFPCADFGGRIMRNARVSRRVGNYVFLILVTGKKTWKCIFTGDRDFLKILIFLFDF